MKVVQINSVCGVGSTGRIAVDISMKLSDKGIENYILYGIGSTDYPQAYKIGNNISLRVHQLGTRLLGKHGFYSKYTTQKIISWLEKIKPDIIHIHQLHGHYLNVEILFNYLSKLKIPIVWTLHDCWAFTGHCVHFDDYGCDKWKTGCYDCPQLRSYPDSWIFDRSKESYRDKKRLFTSIENMTIVTPSSWLRGKVKESFLGKYPVEVIFNGVDTNIFKPSKSISIRDKYGINDKFIILGVATQLTIKKGLIDFIKLSTLLSEDDVIILVGIEDEVIKSLPKNIIGLKKTSDATELVQIYSTADVFLNLSVEETFGLVTAEALACGTPAIVYDVTACPELIDETCGFIVKKANINEIVKTINIIKHSGKVTYKDNCIARVKSNFDKNKNYDEYIELYIKLYNK